MPERLKQLVEYGIDPIALGHVSRDGDSPSVEFQDFVHGSRCSGLVAVVIHDYTHSRAMPFPTPLLAPVTSATLPSRDIASVSFHLRSICGIAGVSLTIMPTLEPPSMN